MTYDNLALALISESNNSILDIDKEISNFNKILESIYILNENGILLEEDKVKTTLKEKLIKLWDRIKEVFTNLINKIKGFISKKKEKEKEQTEPKKYILISDFEIDWYDRNPDYLFDSIPKLNDFLTKVNDFLANNSSLLLNSDNIINIEDTTEDIIKEIDTMINDIKNDFDQLEKKYKDSRSTINVGTDVSSMVEKLNNEDVVIHKKMEDIDKLIDKYKENSRKIASTSDENSSYILKINAKIIELLTEAHHKCVHVAVSCYMLAGKLEKAC